MRVGAKYSIPRSKGVDIQGECVAIAYGAGLLVCNGRKYLFALNKAGAPALLTYTEQERRRKRFYKGVSGNWDEDNKMPIVSDDVFERTQKRRGPAVVDLMLHVEEHGVRLSDGTVVPPGNPAKRSALEAMITSFGGTKLDSEQEPSKETLCPMEWMMWEQGCPGFGPKGMYSIPPRSPMLESLLRSKDTAGGGSKRAAEFLEYISTL